MDAAGDLFIADTGNNVVREVNLATGDHHHGRRATARPATAATAARPPPPSWTTRPASPSTPPATCSSPTRGNNVIREVNAQHGDHHHGRRQRHRRLQRRRRPGHRRRAELARRASRSTRSGDLFIADSGNNVIREVNLKAGMITTVAGTGGSTGFSGDGGPAAAALLANPAGIAVDSAGRLYISDSADNVIREIFDADEPGSDDLGRQGPSSDTGTGDSGHARKGVSGDDYAGAVPGSSIDKTARSRHKASRVIVVQLSEGVRDRPRRVWATTP